MLSAIGALWPFAAILAGAVLLVWLWRRTSTSEARAQVAEVKRESVEVQEVAEQRYEDVRALPLPTGEEADELERARLRRAQDRARESMEVGDEEK